MGTIVASSEVKELLVNCDTVWALYEGRNVIQFDPECTTADEVVYAIIKGGGVQ